MKTKKDNVVFEHLDDVPEMIRLYAEISGDCDKDTLDRCNWIYNEAMDYDGRDNRPVRIKQAFANAVKCLNETGHKPVNDALVSKTKLFFSYAVAGNFTSAESLRRFMDDDVDFIETLARTAKHQRSMNQERRAAGIALRKLRKKGLS